MKIILILLIFFVMNNNSMVLDKNHTKTLDDKNIDSKFFSWLQHINRTCSTECLYAIASCIDKCYCSIPPCLCCYDCYTCLGPLYEKCCPCMPYFPCSILLRNIY